MNESHLVVFVWLAISSAYVITGVGFTSIARKIHPYGWPLYILGAGYSFFGVFGIVTVVIALVRIYNGYNPAYGEIGYVGYVRLVTGTMFSCFVAGLTTVSAYRMANFDAAERQIVLEAAKTFAQLKRTVEEVRG